MTVEIVKEPTREQYTLYVDGEERGHLSYIESGSTIDLPHTVVDPSLRGSGLGAQLVEETLDDIRDSGDLRVIPTCPFVATWILKHPDYQGLTSR